jgi:hypothetical protein
MSDILQQHANSNNLTRFTQDWYIQKQIPLENGVPKNGQDYSQQILNDFRMYKNNKDTPKLDTSKAKPVTTQGYTTGYGMMSAEAAQELISADDIADAAIKIGSAVFGSPDFKDGLKSLFTTGFGNLLDGAKNILQKEVELRNKLNSQIAIGGELSRGYRDNIVDAFDGVQGMGYSFDELADTAISATKETGRFFTMNESIMENMAVTSRAFIGDMKEMAPVLRNFELVGIGAEKTLENINTAGKSSLTLGLNARRTTEELNKNIGKLNQYGFENGTQGLNRMVQKSIEFRMNMQNVFDIAEKVMSPEKAIDLAANLQVLGGAVGALGDPFQMMYMATNNVEGLQDALIGAAESLAVYSEENGKFEITGVNLRRARAMADELGMSYQDLSNMAIAAAERTSAAADLMAAGISVDDKEKEFITNLARMGKDGRMVIEVPPSLAQSLGIERTQALEDLDQATASAILANQTAFEAMDPKDIALEQFTETQKLALNVSQIAAMLKVEFAKTYRGLGGEIDKYVASANDMLEKYVTGEGSSGDIKTYMDEQRSILQKAVTDDQKSKGATAVPVQPTSVNNAANTTTAPSTTAPLNTDSTPSEQFMMKFFNEVNKQKPTFIIQNNVDPTNERSYTRGS